MRRRFPLFIAAALLLVAGPGTADCVVPPRLTASSPAPDELVEVTARLFLIDVFEIDDVAQAFRADVVAELTWTDARLSEANLGQSLEGCALSHEAVWNPEPRLVNGREATLRFPKPVKVDSAGNVRYAQRFTGLLTTRLDLREFPFDTQTLPIIVAFAAGLDKVKIVTGDEPLTHDRGFSVAGWRVSMEGAMVEPLVLARDLTLPQYRVVMRAQRERGFYLGKMLLPVVLIVLMAWGAYWLDPGAQPPRFGLSTSSVLTLIAFKLALGMWLPRVEYLTRADLFMIGAMSLVFLTLAEVVVTSALDGPRRELALRINRTGRWVYPLAFVLVLVVTLLV